MKYDLLEKWQVWETWLSMKQMPVLDLIHITDITGNNINFIIKKSWWNIELYFIG